MATIEIELTKGQVAYIDEEDYELVSRHSWSATEKGHRRTRYARAGVRDADGKNYTIRMHRLILGLEKGDGIIVDHINGNGLDNRRENLRTGSYAQNARNVATTRRSTSGYKGVFWRKARSVWISQIRFNGKLSTVAYTQCKHDAARIYNKHATELFGEHAWLNDVEECGCDACGTSKKKATSS